MQSAEQCNSHFFIISFITKALNSLLSRFSCNFHLIFYIHSLEEINLEFVKIGTSFHSNALFHSSFKQHFKRVNESNSLMHEWIVIVTLLMYKPIYVENDGFYSILIIFPLPQLRALIFFMKYQNLTFSSFHFIMIEIIENVINIIRCHSSSLRFQSFAVTKATRRRRLDFDFRSIIILMIH